MDEEIRRAYEIVAKAAIDLKTLHDNTATSSTAEQAEAEVASLRLKLRDLAFEILTAGAGERTAVLAQSVNKTNSLIAEKEAALKQLGTRNNKYKRILQFLSDGLQDLQAAKVCTSHDADDLPDLAGKSSAASDILHPLTPLNSDREAPIVMNSSPPEYQEMLIDCRLLV